MEVDMDMERKMVAVENVNLTAVARLSQLFPDLKSYRVSSLAVFCFCDHQLLNAS